MKHALGLILGLIVVSIIWWQLDRLKDKKPIDKIAQQNIDKLLASKNLKPGNPVFIRIFKKSSELELWVQQDNKYILLKNYPICSWSGKLGPKLKQGDKQSPEGFYKVGKSQLNPNSKYHLSFNLGYPNRFDKAHRRTGDYLMVHGKCVSVGCYAITDTGISEVYKLVESALNKGQDKFEVHIFPFRMTDVNLENYKNNQWHPFWQELKPAYDWFETNQTLPNIRVKGKNYLVTG